MKNIAYIISNIDKAIAFEWIAESALNRNYKLHFILLNPGPSQLQQYCDTNNIPCTTVIYRGKKSMLRAILATRRILKNWKIDLVHCHLFDAGIAGITAAYLAGIQKRIYTRHHSDIHLVSFPRAVKYDRYINRMSTHVVAVTQMVQQLMVEKEKIPLAKTSVIHHGFKFEKTDENYRQKVSHLRKKYALEGKSPVIGIVSRYIKVKGLEYMITAFEKLKQQYPQAHLVLANTKGDQKAQVQGMLQKLPAGSYTEIEFETDIFALYGCFDVFLHCPIGVTAEAFGQVYIEALAFETPSIFTLSGIAAEVMHDTENCLVVPFENAEKIHEKMLAQLQQKILDTSKMQAASQHVRTQFSLEHMIAQLNDLYAR